ncbi:hypothetical protein QTP86_028449 [Hemibagrus guttatus]|nr:hypothetical protein QTP86_028449 [Hemibagrus guttatus]
MPILNVLNVVEQGILFGPVLKVRPAAENPGVAAAPEMTESEPQAQPAAENPPRATTTPEEHCVAEPVMVKSCSADLISPTERIIKVWPVGADSVLQDRFQHTDWSMFASEATCGTHTDINTYTSSVLDYINTTIDSVTMEKQITTYPNQKPWMNKEVRLLLNARNAVFRSGDTQAYSTSRANLMRGIKNNNNKTKYCYKLKAEEHFSNSDPRCMWQGNQ